MEIASKKLYMREHSNVVRIWSSSSRQSMVENPAFHIDRRSRVMIVCICRIRQRLLKQAWQTFTERTGVKHDYNQDLRTILSRQLPADELRTELEIEVLYKWVMQAKDIDPTGIASTIFHCKKKGAIYNALQQLRLEYYGPGEVVIYQGDYPRMEDGHFTILSGECEVLQFTGDSVRLTKLLACARKRRWEEAKELLEAAQVVAHIPTFSGFGELSTLTGVKRAATILTSKISDISEIVVLPKHPLLDLLKYRNKETTQSSEQSEAIDFLRQSGLANRISPKDLVLAASSMSKRTLHEGDILYYKGEEVKCIYMVVSGEFLLDTNDFILEGVIPMPFVNSTSDSCHNLSAGSILGDEGVIGETRVFESTAAVVSSVAVVFQAEGFAMNFISEKMGCLRYSALFYRDRLCWEAEHQVAEQINPYTFFDSLRKSIAYTKPFRGTKKLKEEEVETPIVALVKQRKAARIQKLNEPTTAGKSSYLSGRKSPSGRRSPTHRADRPITPKTFAMNELRKTLDTSLFPRVLRGMALHRALEINKTVKRFLQNCIKNHAKENILHEELKRRTLEEKMLQNEGIRGHDATIDELQNDDDTEKRQTKSAFEKSLRDYYDRSAEVTRKLAEAAELNRTQAVSTGAAVRFFSLLSEDDNDSIGSQSSMTVSENGRLTATASVDNSNNLMTDEHGNAVDSASKLGSTKRSKHNSNHHNIYITPTSSHASSAHSLVVKDEKNPQLYQSKIKEYFEWLDGLKRQQFRALLNQSQQTIDINSDYDIEAKLGINILIDGGKGLSDEQGVDWNEISEVFQTYSLTPADLQLPWIFARVASNSNPPSPVHGILKHNSSQHLGSPKHQLGSPIMSPMALGGGGRSASAKLKISPTAQTDGRPQSPKSNTVLAKPVSPKNKITFNDVPQVKEIPKNNPNDKRGRSRNNNSKVDKNKNNSKRGGVQNPPSKVSASSPSPSPSPAPSERRKSQLGNGRRGGIVPLNARPLSPEDEHYEELKARAFVQREVGGTGYIPSDWRGDYIAKKANDLNMMPLEFHRFKVPENRRTLPLHVRVHDFDEKLHEKFLSSSHTGHHTNNAEPKKESPRTKEGKPPLSLQVSFADRERRSNDGKSKPPNIGQIPTSPSNNTILTGLSKESKDEKQLAELKAQLMEYIDSPEFFLQHLLTADVSSKNRKVDSGFGWNTRYMTSQENQKKQPPPILKAVRTHLEENLDAYSKEHLLNVFEDLKNQNYEQAMKAILGKKDYANKSNTLTSSATATALGGSGGRIGLLKREDSDRSSYSPTPSLSRSVSYRDKVEGAGEGAIATTNQTYPFLTPEHRRPSWKEDEEAELSRKLSIILETNETASNSITGAKSQELLENSSSAVSGNIPRPAQLLLSRENSLQDLLSLPSGESSVTGEEGTVPKKSALKSSAGTIGRKSSPAPLSRANSNSNVNSPKKPGKSALSRSNSKSNLPTPTHHSPTQQVLSADSSNSVSPGGIAMATTLSNPISATASNNVTFSTVKLSDIKAPSKALQMFEDFMQQQQMPSKAASEGRKKANRTSRFRLPAMIAQEERTNNNIHELVNIREVQKDRLKMELTLFQALNPHYTQKDKEIFIESFKNLNPTLSTSMQQINMILSDIEHEIEENSENVQRQLFIKKMQERRTNTSSFDGSAMHSRQFSAESLLSANTPYSPQLSNPRGMSGISRFSFLSSPDGNASSPKPFATSPSPSATSAANHTQWDEQMQLERWQEYTLQNILQNKNGERKTLPLVKLPKLMTEMSGGKKYRSSASTKAVLITLPAKVEEESIEGPTSYLELYKSSFKVRTSSKAKAKVVEELKLKLPHH